MTNMRISVFGVAITSYWLYSEKYLMGAIYRERDMEGGEVPLWLLSSSGGETWMGGTAPW